MREYTPTSAFLRAPAETETVRRLRSALPDATLVEVDIRLVFGEVIIDCCHVNHLEVSAAVAVVFGVDANPRFEVTKDIMGLSSTEPFMRAHVVFRLSDFPGGLEALAL